MNTIPDRQVAGVYHRQVGDITVTALHDGHQDVSMTTVKDIPPDAAERLLRESFRPVPRRTAVNAFLIRSAGRVALVAGQCLRPRSRGRLRSWSRASRRKFS